MDTSIETFQTAAYKHQLPHRTTS